MKMNFSQLLRYFFEVVSEQTDCLLRYFENIFLKGHDMSFKSKNIIRHIIYTGIIMNRNLRK